MTTLSLAAPKTGSIPPCSPHLMPFHIAYTGPAPVSTYFRLTHPKPTSPPVLVEGSNSNKPSIEQSDSQTTLVAAESQQTLANDVDMLTLSESVSSAANVHDLNGAQGDAKHMTAAFRGRTVRGLDVALPEGYTGLVFASPSSSSASSTSASNAQRSTRNSAAHSSTRNSKYFKDEEEDREEERRTKKLEPTGRFSSFTLWNADIPVDEGRDEYLRALTEWTRLATVIHQYDEDA